VHRADRLATHLYRGGVDMRWEEPSFVEVNMDAEIGGYQDDLGDPPDISDPRSQSHTVPVDGEPTKPTKLSTS